MTEDVAAIAQAVVNKHLAERDKYLTATYVGIGIAALGIFFYVKRVIELKKNK